MKVRILNSTNEKIKEFIGEERNYFQMYGCACLENLTEPGYGIRTSKLITEKREGNIITIKTKNSDYELEVLDEVDNENN